jgi:tetratricopeptide (TPR) repeat protein
MTRLSFPVVTVVALATLVACGAPQQEAIKPGDVAVPNPQVTRKVTSGDVAFELPAIEIKGVVYGPEAIEHPGMPLVDPKKPTRVGDKTAIEKQRALVQSTKEPVAKQAQAAILATMLYRESKADKGKEKDKLTDARQVLRDVAQAVGDKNVDEITLRLLGSYEILLEDYPAAEKAWAGLIERDPKSKELAYNKAWLAYAQLKQFKNADALATVGSDKPDDKEPELAYFAAWAKLRTGDGAGAWQAITAAARGWGNTGKHEDIERDVLFIAGRANVAVDQAAPVVTGVLGKIKQQQYELLAKLGLTGYALAGRWTSGIAALDKAVALAGDTVPANDRPVIRNAQADFTVRLDTPEAASAFAKQALEALEACKDKCTAKDKADTIQGVYLMGRLFHILYATANDHRYYEPAHQLYDLTIPKLDPTTQAQAQGDLKKLETTLRNMKVGTGTHDKSAIGALLPRHNLEVEACYEQALMSNPKLGGTVAVHLESDQTGAIKGVSTEPKAGAQDLSAVAGCIAERAKDWKLPKRGMPGNTRIKVSFTLSARPPG